MLATIFLAFSELKVPAQLVSSVKVTRVQRAIYGFRQFYYVSFYYAFDNYNNIFITGLGQVSPRGSFTYYTENPIILFRESESGLILKRINLTDSRTFTFNTSKNTIASRITSDDLVIKQKSIDPSLSIAQGVDNFPSDEKKFGNKSTVESWIRPPELSNILNQVLNTKFPLGYNNYQRDSKFYFMTSWTKLPELPENMRGEISILISYSIPDKPRDTIKYSISTLVREKRLKESQWSFEVSDKTEAAASKYVKNFIDNLKKNRS